MIDTGAAATTSLPGRRLNPRWIESLLFSVALVCGGAMLIDAYGPRKQSAAFTHPPAAAPEPPSAESVFPLTDDGGIWIFAETPWTVEFHYGATDRGATPAVEPGLSGTLMPDLQTFLMELGARRTSENDSDRWQLERPGITVTVLTRSTPDGTVLQGIDIAGAEGVFNPSATRMSFRPRRQHLAVESAGHLLPLSSCCVPICTRVRADGNPSLEVIRSRETVAERNARFQTAGWQLVAAAGDSLQLWGKNGQRVNVFEIQKSDSRSGELVWAAILHN